MQLLRFARDIQHGQWYLLHLGKVISSIAFCLCPSVILPNGASAGETAARQWVPSDHVGTLSSYSQHSVSFTQHRCVANGVNGRHLGFVWSRLFWLASDVYLTVE